MNLIINPGTEAQEKHSRKNADKSINNFIEDTGLKGLTYTYKSVDDRGFYDYEVKKGTFKKIISVPGIEPEVVRKGEPFESPRIYVDGSSWLWGYGLGIFCDYYKDYLFENERKI